jgi:hypothetical protein
LIKKNLKSHILGSANEISSYPKQNKGLGP